MFLKKIIPCLIVALGSVSMSGCVMAEPGHYGPASGWHHHHHSAQSWNEYDPASPVNVASQHMGPPPAPDSASQHMGPPPAPGSAAQHMGPPSDGGIHRWQP